MQIQPSAVAALDRITAVSHAHGAKLHIVVTTNYPWDDYRLLPLGYWPLSEQALRKIATYEDVVSFAQYNALTTEVAAPNMK